MVKRKRELRDDLIKMAYETEVVHTWEYAKGCSAVCPCCGARCQNHRDCGKDGHQSKYHRPWGFAYNEEQNK